MLDEEDKGFSDQISKIFADATYEAYLEAMRTVGYVTICRDRHIVTVYSDGREKVIKKI